MSIGSLETAAGATEIGLMILKATLRLKNVLTFPAHKKSWPQCFAAEQLGK